MDNRALAAFVRTELSKVTTAVNKLSVHLFSSTKSQHNSAIAGLIGAQSHDEESVTDQGKNASRNHTYAETPRPTVNPEPQSRHTVIEIYDPKAEKKETREKVKFLVDCATPIILVASAGVTLFTLLALKESNRIAKETFEAANRPYVGIEDVATVHSRVDATGSLAHGRDRTPDSVDMTFTVRIKNFGNIPATNANGHCRVFWGATEVQSSANAGTGTVTMYPGVGYNLAGDVGTGNYMAIIDGKATLELWCTIYYEWPGHKNNECTKQRYDPIFNVFLNLGSCPL